MRHESDKHRSNKYGLRVDQFLALSIDNLSSDDVRIWPSLTESLF